MAGVVKGAQQVSNGIPGEQPEPLCVSPTTQLYEHAFNNSHPGDDSNSLQDMIESELAFRMSCPAEDQDEASSPSEGAMANGHGPRVSEFLERERSHCSESCSASPSCSEEQAAPLCSGDDFDDVLGASEPADSDFSPNLRPDDPALDQDADQDEGTVAEGESLGDMDPERKSLLDLDPLESELDGSGQPEPAEGGSPAEAAASPGSPDSAPSTGLLDATPLVNGVALGSVANSMSECVAVLESHDAWSTVGEALMHQLDSASEVSFNSARRSKRFALAHPNRT